eukprot:513889-Hanusia_phi.AAC.1
MHRANPSEFASDAGLGPGDTAGLGELTPTIIPSGIPHGDKSFIITGVVRGQTVSATSLTEYPG